MDPNQSSPRTSERLMQRTQIRLEKQEIDSPKDSNQQVTMESSEHDDSTLSPAKLTASRRKRSPAQTKSPKKSLSGKATVKTSSVSTQKEHDSSSGSPQLTLVNSTSSAVKRISFEELETHQPEPVHAQEPESSTLVSEDQLTHPNVLPRNDQADQVIELPNIQHQNLPHEDQSDEMFLNEAENGNCSMDSSKFQSSKNNMEASQCLRTEGERQELELDDSSKNDAGKFLEKRTGLFDKIADIVKEACTSKTASSVMESNCDINQGTPIDLDPVCDSSDSGARPDILKTEPEEEDAASQPTLSLAQLIARISTRINDKSSTKQKSDADISADESDEELDDCEEGSESDDNESVTSTGTSLTSTPKSKGKLVLKDDKTKSCLTETREKNSNTDGIPASAIVGMLPKTIEISDSEDDVSKDEELIGVEESTNIEDHHSFSDIDNSMPIEGVSDAFYDPNEDSREDLSLEDQVRELLKSRKSSSKIVPSQIEIKTEIKETTQSDFETFAAFEKKRPSSEADGKTAAFASSELEMYLEENKVLELPSLSAVDADVDTVEGVTFLSFSSKEFLDDFVVNEANSELKSPNKNNSSSSSSKKRQTGSMGSPRKKQFQHGVGNVSQYLKNREEIRIGMTGENDPIQNMNASIENDTLETHSSTTDIPTQLGSDKSPSKTNDITKIKGWRNKYQNNDDEASQDLSGDVTSELPGDQVLKRDLIRIMRAEDLASLGLSVYVQGPTKSGNPAWSKKGKYEGYAHGGQYDMMMLRKDTVGHLDAVESQQAKGKVYGRRNDGKFATKAAIIAAKKRGRPYKTFLKRDPAWNPQKQQPKPAAPQRKKGMALRPVILSKKMVTTALQALSAPEPTSLDHYLGHMEMKKANCEKPGCKYQCMCDRANTPTLAQFMEDYLPPQEDTSDDPYPPTPRPEGGVAPACGLPHCVLGCVCPSLAQCEEKSVTEKTHCGQAECVFGCDCMKQTRAVTRALRSNLWLGKQLDPGSRSDSPVPIGSGAAPSSVQRPRPFRPDLVSQGLLPDDQIKQEPGDYGHNMIPGDMDDSARRKSRRIKDRPNFAQLDKMNSLIYYDTSLWMESGAQHLKKQRGQHDPSVPSKTSPNKSEPQRAKQQGSTSAGSKKSKKKRSIDAEARFRLQEEYDLDLVDSDDENAPATCARSRLYIPVRQRHKTESPKLPVISSVCSLTQSGADTVPVQEPEDDSCLITDSEPPRAKRAKPAKSDQTHEPSQKKINTQMVLLQKKSKGRDKSTHPILLEIKSDCVWSLIRAKLLSKISSVISKGDQYPYNDFYVEDYRVEIIKNVNSGPVKIPPHMMTPDLQCKEMVPVRFFVTKDNPKSQNTGPSVQDGTPSGASNKEEITIDLEQEDDAPKRSSDKTSSDVKAPELQAILTHPQPTTSSTSGRKLLTQGSSRGVSSFNHFKITAGSLFKSGSGSFAVKSGRNDRLSMDNLETKPSENTNSGASTSQMQGNTKDKIVVLSDDEEMSEKKSLADKVSPPRGPKGPSGLGAQQYQQFNVNSALFRELTNLKTLPRLVFRSGGVIYDLPDLLQKHVSPQLRSNTETSSNKQKSPIAKVLTTETIHSLQIENKKAKGDHNEENRSVENKSPIPVNSPNASPRAAENFNTSESLPVSPIIPIVGRSPSNVSDMPVLIAQEMGSKDHPHDDISSRSASPPTLEAVHYVSDSPEPEVITIPSPGSSPQRTADTQIQESLSMLESLESSTERGSDDSKANLDPPTLTVSPAKSASSTDTTTTNTSPSKNSECHHMSGANSSVTAAVSGASQSVPLKITQIPSAVKTVSHPPKQASVQSNSPRLAMVLPGKSVARVQGPSTSSARMMNPGSQAPLISLVRANMIPQKLSTPTVQPAGTISTGTGPPKPLFLLPVSSLKPLAGKGNTAKSPLAVNAKSILRPALVQAVAQAIKTSPKVADSNTDLPVTQIITNADGSVSVVQLPKRSAPSGAVNMSPVVSKDGMTAPPVVSLISPPLTSPNKQSTVNSPVSPGISLVRPTIKSPQTTTTTVSPPRSTGPIPFTINNSAGKKRKDNETEPINLTKKLKCDNNSVVSEPRNEDEPICLDNTDDSENVLMPPKVAQDACPDIRRRSQSCDKDASQQTNVSHYKIAGSQVLEKGHNPLSNVTALENVETKKKCPVHGEKNIFSKTTDVRQFGFVVNGKFQALPAEDIRLLGLTNVEINMDKDHLPVISYRRGATKASQPDALKSPKPTTQESDPIVIPDSPKSHTKDDSELSTKSKGHADDKLNVSSEQMLQRQMMLAVPSESGSDSMSSYGSTLSEGIRRNSIDSTAAADMAYPQRTCDLDDVDILGLDEDNEPAALRLRTQIGSVGLTPNTKRHADTMEKKKKRKQLHADRTCHDELEIEENIDDPLDPNRPSTPELLENSGTDRIVYKCKSPLINTPERLEIHNKLERRRRHDMTYKFQMLQSILYPSSNTEKMSKHFILKAAQKTIHGLNKEFKQLSEELEQEKAKRDRLVLKVKSMKAQQKQASFTAITVDEVTGRTTVSADPLLDRVHLTPDPPGGPTRRPRHVAVKHSAPTRTSPKSASSKTASQMLFNKLQRTTSARGVPTDGTVSLTIQGQTVNGQKVATGLKQSPILGAMAKDTAQSLRQSRTLSRNTSVSPDKAEPVSGLIMAKCAKCQEKLAYTAQSGMDLNCPTCGYLVIRGGAQRSESSLHIASCTSLKPGVSLAEDEDVEILDDLEQAAESSSSEVEEILKDGVKGYVDNVGEDEVIVIVKDEAHKHQELDAEEGSSSTSAEQTVPMNARKKLGF